MSQKILAFLASVFLAGCVSTSVTPVGNKSFPEIPMSKEIAVYSKESEVTASFEIVAIIDHNDAGKYQFLTLADALPKVKEKARKVGANAIILDDVQAVKSGIISTGIHVRARAIRVANDE